MPCWGRRGRDKISIVMVEIDEVEVVRCSAEDSYCRFMLVKSGHHCNAH